MQKIFFTTLFFIFFCFTTEAQEKEVPAALQPYVMSGYDVLDFATGDLNGDKLNDYILILKTKGEDTLSFDNPEWEAARPVLLLLQQPGGSLKSVSSSTSIVPCRLCGGMMGDPYEAITVKSNEFSFSSYGGSSWRWEDAITFRYDKIKKDWFLQSHHITSFQAGDPEATTTDTHIDRAEIGDISFSSYTQNYNADSSQWKVKAAKTFFYESPKLKSTPKKAYVLKGDVVKGYKTFANFVECTFENSKGQLTTGFILKKDLQVLPGSQPKAIQ